METSGAPTKLLVPTHSHSLNLPHIRASANALRAPSYDLSRHTRRDATTPLK